MSHRFKFRPDPRPGYPAFECWICARPFWRHTRSPALAWIRRVPYWPFLLIIAGLWIYILVNTHWS